MKHLFTLLCCLLVSSLLYAQETDCNDGIDNDGNGLVDYFDPTCNCDTTGFFSVCTGCNYTIDTAKPIGVQQRYLTNSLISTYHSPIVADLDGDNVPELILMDGDTLIDAFPRYSKNIKIFDGQTGLLEQTIITPFMPWSTVAPVAVADVDLDGLGELIIATVDHPANAAIDRARLICYEHDGTFKWRSNVAYGTNATSNFGAAVQLADFNADRVAEVYVYNEIFNAQTGVLLAEGGANGIGMSSDLPIGSMALSTAADLRPAAGLELAAGNTVYEVSITNLTGTAGNAMLPISLPLQDGFTSVADIDQDGALDVVVTYGAFATGGTAPGLVYVWNPRGFPSVLAQAPVLSPSASVAFVGDIDGDCAPEIGIGRENTVELFDYNGTTTLQSKWTLPAVDASGSTGITMFDFNQDGLVEIVYRDEVELRIIDGSGAAPVVLETFPCLARTGYDMPIIADATGDGRANICVTCAINNTDRVGNVLVLEGGNGNSWAPTRSVWNQYGYHVTNIKDDLSIPVQAQNHAAFYPATACNSNCGSNAQPLNNFLVQTTTLDGQGCPVFDAVDALIDLDTFIVGCNNGADSIILRYTIRNNGAELLPAGTPIAVYNGDPTQAGSQLLQLETVPQNVQPMGQLVSTTVIPMNLSSVSTLSIFVFVNDNGSRTLPLDSLGQQMPVTNLAECNFNNNLSGQTQPIFCSALPIDWLSFDCENLDDNKVQLTWEFVNDPNNQGFEIERSTDEGQSFEPIAWIPNYNTNPITMRLTWQDVEPKFQTSYYKIKQVDKDGSFTYSSICASSRTTPLLDVQVGPNPVQDELTILLSSHWKGGEQVKILVSNTLGQVMDQATYAVNGTTQLQLDTSTWPKGAYLLQLYANGLPYHQWVIKN